MDLENLDLEEDTRKWRRLLSLLAAAPAGDALRNALMPPSAGDDEAIA